MSNLSSCNRAGSSFFNGKTPQGRFRGPFDIEKSAEGEISACPALWNHDANLERRLVVQPDRQGLVREGMEEKAERVWQTETRLHFNRDFQLNSQSLGGLPDPGALYRREGLAELPPLRHRPHRSAGALVQYYARPVGLLVSRQQAGRATTTISQLPDMPVLDVRTLTPDQVGLSKRIFRKFSKLDFLPANEADHDKVRKDLDQEVLGGLLGLPASVSEDPLEKLNNLRKKWCAEPSVHGGKGRRTHA